MRFKSILTVISMVLMLVPKIGVAGFRKIVLEDISVGSGTYTSPSGKVTNKTKINASSFPFKTPGFTSFSPNDLIDGGSDVDIQTLSITTTNATVNNSITVGNDAVIDDDLTVGGAVTITGDLIADTVLDIRPLVVKSAAYTATATDTIILVDATSAAVTITLPAASGIEGQAYTFKKTDASANAVTIDGNLSETIDGSTTYTLADQYDSVETISDGTNWVISAGVDVASATIPSIRDISRNLVIENGSTSDELVDINADELMLQSLSGVPLRLTTVNLTADNTASGVNGFFTGSVAANTFYSLWVTNGSTGTTSGIHTSEAIATVLGDAPAGYDTYAALVGWIQTDATSDFILIHQEGNNVVRSNIEVLAGGTATAYTSVDLSSAIPTTAKKIHGELSLDISAGGPTAVSGQVASDSNGLGVKQIQIANSNGNAISSPFSLILSEAQTLYYLTASSATQDMHIDISGWEY
jgi:hypothetical protein